MARKLGKYLASQRHSNELNFPFTIFLFSFNSCRVNQSVNIILIYLRQREDTDSEIRRKKHSAAPPRIEPRVFRFVHERSRPLSYEATTEENVWVAPFTNCESQHYVVTSMLQPTSTKWPATSHWILLINIHSFNSCQVYTISNHHSFLLRRREETDSGIWRKKNSTAPLGIEPRVFRFIHGR